MKRILIIGGKGEVGSAMGKVEKKAGNKVFISDLDCEPERGKYDIIHICIPYSERFKDIVLTNLKVFQTDLAIIHSTVPIGTTESIANKTDTEIVHSPVRGIHPNLYKGIIEFVKYIGGDEDSAEKCIEHFESIGIEPYYLGSAEHSELAKLLSTTYYGWNILFAKEAQKLCDTFGLNYDKVYKHPNVTYNLGYSRLGMKHVVRPILYPPEKEGAGGHCIVENLLFLHKPGDTLTESIMSIGKKSENIFRDKIWLTCEYHGKHKTAKQIGIECGVSGTTISNWLKKLKIPEKPEPYWTEDECNLLEELSQEMTFKEIADNNLLDRTYESIRMQASKLKIKSSYNPGEMEYNTRKKISCTLQNIDIDNFEGFTTSLNQKLRKSLQYREWRQHIFKRDNWTCQNPNCRYCGNKKGIHLHAHHKKSWSEYPELRLYMDNGISYCYKYHLNCGIHKNKK